jgi:hypothetical protein
MMGYYTRFLQPQLAPQQELLMKVRQLVLCAFMLIALPAIANNAPANNAPPTEASIQQLLELTNVRQLLDQVKLQMDGVMSSAMRNAQQGQTLTPERQAVLDRMKEKMIATMNEALNWDMLQPMYVRTYRESLTQDELDGMIKFYKSAAGRAYIKKMPVIMQNIMGEMQGILKPLQERLADIQKETIQELKDLKPSQGASTS